MDFLRTIAYTVSFFAKKDSNFKIFQIEIKALLDLMVIDPIFDLLMTLNKTTEFVLLLK